MLQRIDALKKLLSKYHLFFLHGDSMEPNGASLVMRFDELPIQIDGGHVFVGLQI